MPWNDDKWELRFFFIANRGDVRVGFCNERPLCRNRKKQKDFPFSNYTRFSEELDCTWELDETRVVVYVIAHASTFTRAVLAINRETTFLSGKKSLESASDPATVMRAFEPVIRRLALSAPVTVVKRFDCFQNAIWTCDVGNVCDEPPTRWLGVG